MKRKCSRLHVCYRLRADACDETLRDEPKCAQMIHFSIDPLNIAAARQSDEVICG